MLSEKKMKHFDMKKYKISHMLMKLEAFPLYLLFNLFLFSLLSVDLVKTYTCYDVYDKKRVMCNNVLIFMCNVRVGGSDAVKTNCAV